MDLSHQPYMAATMRMLRRLPEKLHCSQGEVNDKNLRLSIAPQVVRRRTWAKQVRKICPSEAWKIPISDQFR